MYPGYSTRARLQSSFANVGPSEHVEKIVVAQCAYTLPLGYLIGMQFHTQRHRVHLLIDCADNGFATALGAVESVESVESAESVECSEHWPCSFAIPIQDAVRRCQGCCTDP